MKSEKITEQSDFTNLTRTQRARREDILRAATEVMNENGFAGASLEKIAARANTSKSTLLYHFASKKAVYQALAGSIFEDGAQYVASYIKQASESREKLRMYVVHSLLYVADNAESISALREIERNLQDQDYVNSSQYIQDKAPVEWIRALLAEGQVSGAFNRDFDPLMVALSLRQIIDSASDYMLYQPEFETSRYVEQVARTFKAATDPR